MALVDPSGFAPNWMDVGTGALQMGAGGAVFWGFAVTPIGGGAIVVATTVAAVGAASYLVVDGGVTLVAGLAGVEYPGMAQHLSSQIFGSEIPANVVDVYGIKGLLENAPNAAGVLADSVEKIAGVVGVIEGYRDLLDNLNDGRDGSQEDSPAETASDGRRNRARAPMGAFDAGLWIFGMHGTGTQNTSDVAWANREITSSGPDTPPQPPICGPTTKPCGGK